LKDTFHNLYLGQTNGIPKDENGKEFEVVYCLENDKEISSELEKNSDMRYLLIVLQKTRADLDNGIRRVKSEWNSFSDLTLKLEHITDYRNKMKKSFRELLNECENETVIFKSQVVGFNERSATETKEARKLILGVATKSKLNFWS
jgi:sugar-specific transcriptional regulator TrmB